MQKPSEQRVYIIELAAAGLSAAAYFFIVSFMLLQGRPYFNFSEYVMYPVIIFGVFFAYITLFKKDALVEWPEQYNKLKYVYVFGPSVFAVLFSVFTIAVGADDKLYVILYFLAVAAGVGASRSIHAYEQGRYRN